MSFVCGKCDHALSFWMGRCPRCGEWGEIGPSKAGSPKRLRPSELLDAEGARRSVLRYRTGLEPLDLVLGGGLVTDSVVFLGGEPGIGKSTLVLEMVRAFAARSTLSMLYASGEESMDQIRDRAERLGVVGGRHTHLMGESQLEAIFEEALRVEARFLIVDSLQTAYLDAAAAPAASITQLKAVGYSLMQFAKKQKVACLLIGHVTKEGDVAGPHFVEHMVDTVLLFEGEASRPERRLKPTKNRFGSTQASGLFEMHEKGLRALTVPSEGLA